MRCCPRCKNSEININDNYCKICGLDLKGEAAAATAAPKITIIVPDALKPRDVAIQLDKFKYEYIKGLPINF